MSSLLSIFLFGHSICLIQVFFKGDKNDMGKLKPHDSKLIRCNKNRHDGCNISGAGIRSLHRFIGLLFGETYVKYELSFRNEPDLFDDIISSHLLSYTQVTWLPSSFWSKFLLVSCAEWKWMQLRQRSISFRFQPRRPAANSKPIPHWRFIRPLLL